MVQKLFHRKKFVKIENYITISCDLTSFYFVNRVVFVPEEKLVPSEETTEEDSSAEEFSESLKLSEIQEESTLNHS